MCFAIPFSWNQSLRRYARRRATTFVATLVLICAAVISAAPTQGCEITTSPGVSEVSGRVVVSGSTATYTANGVDCAIEHDRIDLLFGGTVSLGQQAQLSVQEPLGASPGDNLGQIKVGDSGAGTLLLDGGAAVDTGFLQVAKQAGSVGTITLTNGATLVQDAGDAGRINLGHVGTGNLTIDSGSSVSAFSLFVGFGDLLEPIPPGTVSTMLVRGTGSSFSSPSFIAVGNQGARGSVRIESGGLVTAPLVMLGFGGDDAGTLEVRGIGSVLDAGVQINGSALVVDGGMILGSIVLGRTTGPANVGVGSLVVSGIGSQVIGGPISLTRDRFKPGTTLLRAEAGGRIDGTSLAAGFSVRTARGRIEVDGPGSTIAILGQDLSVDLTRELDISLTDGGTLSVRGLGTVVNFGEIEIAGPDSLLWGERIMFFGGVDFLEGTIRADDIVEVVGTGRLNGEGQIEGILNVSTGSMAVMGDIPNSSDIVPGRLDVEGSVILEPGSLLGLVVNGREAGEFSVLGVTGDLVIEGEVRVLFFDGEFQTIFDSPPVPGDSFPVITVDGAVTLNPNSITVVGGPEPDPPFVLQESNGIVSLVVPVPEPAAALAQLAALTTIVAVRRYRRRARPRSSLSQF